MGKQSTSEESVRTSVSSIYSQLLSKRRAEKESEKAMKEEQKRMERELKEQEKGDAENENPELSKKEKRQKELDAWKEIVIGLTGDDIEYEPDKKKSKKRKYRNWIGDDDINAMLEKEKQKKPKKRNYRKEFAPELNMLRTLVAEQNRFTADLQKRFQNAAGPASKDAMIPNKTLVELASVIASGRSNSLGILREIGSLKKNIAELYMKQKKLDSETSGAVDFNTADIGLMGSNIASSMFDDNPFSYSNTNGGNINATSPSAPISPNPVYNQGMEPLQSPQVAMAQVSEPQVTVNAFDPSSWDGPDLGDSYSSYENTPHTVVVEKNRDTGGMRFVALKDDGSEFVGCPVPTSDPSKLRVNEQDGVVKGEFDEVYKLIYV